MLRLDDERMRIQLHRGSMACACARAKWPPRPNFGTDEAWLQPSAAACTGWTATTTPRSRPAGAASCVWTTSPLLVETGRRLQLWREGPPGELRHRVGEPCGRQLCRSRCCAKTAATNAPRLGGLCVARDDRLPKTWTAMAAGTSTPTTAPVWTPSTVRSDWAPYRYGRWAWVRPWGWTWVDDAPWGFAPFHYGRWVSWRGRWGWVPGSYVARPVFAPALVAWLGWHRPRRGLGPP
jgi:hypothetical protein